MADCQHTGRHLHCNICGGAPCADCFGSIAPSPGAFGMKRDPNIAEVYQNKIAALESRVRELEAERGNLVFRNDSLREQTTQLLIQRDNLVIAQDRLKATIARQREWIEKAGHRRKCSVRAPHAATMDYKPTCDCGWAELVGG